MPWRAGARPPAPRALPGRSGPSSASTAPADAIPSGWARPSDHRGVATTASLPAMLRVAPRARHDPVVGRGARRHRTAVRCAEAPSTFRCRSEPVHVEARNDTRHGSRGQDDRTSRWAPSRPGLSSRKIAVFAVSNSSRPRARDRACPPAARAGPAALGPRRSPRRRPRHADRRSGSIGVSATASSMAAPISDAMSRSAARLSASGRRPMTAGGAGAGGRRADRAGGTEPAPRAGRPGPGKARAAFGEARRGRPLRAIDRAPSTRRPPAAPRP